MEELEGKDCAFALAFPPALVSLTPFTPSVSPSPRRLSSCFAQPSKPVRAKRQLAWVSLQGRLVGAEEASSAKTVDAKGAFGAPEAAAWELFTPIQRVLTVAVAAAAAIHSKKNKQICVLQRSVELRDQVLQSMQQKLDNLCEQVSYFNDHSEVLAAASAGKRKDCGCKPCQHHNLPPYHAVKDTLEKGSKGDELLKYNMPLFDMVEPEERRMSDLSDWAPSVSSSVDIQLDARAIEHDISNLQKECEQKDNTIKKLSAYIQSSEVSGSKRIAELEDIIRRKNMIINKLRKDIMILEQKVMNLTRLRRRSSSATSSSAMQLPLMADNVLYDMDSTTSPSSSDSDSSPGNQIQAPALRSQEISVQSHKKTSKGENRIACLEQCQKDCAKSPLKERRANQTPISTTVLEQRHTSSGENTASPLKKKSLDQTPNSAPALKPRHTPSGENRTRRRPHARSKDVTAPKRWL